MSTHIIVTSWRIAVMAAAVFVLCGFVRVHDEAMIGGDGGALARRTVTVEGRVPDSVFVVERRYAGDSPFSSAGMGRVTFSLAHWPADSAMRRDGDAGSPVAHDLVIHMPGPIRSLWGRPAHAAGRTLTLDLLAARPTEADATVVSDADLLHTTWFITLLVAVFMVGMLVMLRRFENR